MNEYITKLKEKFKQMKEIDLPPALTRLKTMRLMIGISIIIISVIAAILLNKIVQVRENEHTKLKRSRNHIKTRVYIVKRHSISKSKSLPLCSFVRL